MVIRMRIYHSEQADHDEADQIFYDLVKPVHEKHGAIFKGRYRNKNGKVVVMWEYESESEMERIQAAVGSDPESLKNKQQRLNKGLHGVLFDEYLLTPTG